MAPCRYIRDIYVLNYVATREGIIFNACHTVRNRYACQSATVIEGIPANIGHTARDCDTRQAATTTKGISADARHTVQDCDTRQSAAVIKCAIQNISARYCHGFQRWRNVVVIVRRGRSTTSIIILLRCNTAGITRCTKDISKWILICITACDAPFCANKRNGYTLKRWTTWKRRRSNTRYTVRDYNAWQTTTAREGVATDACHTFRNCDACQSTAIIECTCWNSCYIVSNVDCCKVGTTFEYRIIIWTCTYACCCIPIDCC